MTQFTHRDLEAMALITPEPIVYREPLAKEKPDFVREDERDWRTESEDKGEF